MLYTLFVFLSLNMAKKTYHCPRCGNKNIVEYSESFDCPVCRLEFEKKDCDELDDENVLAIEEKLSFVRVMGLDKDNNKL